MSRTALIDGDEIAYKLSFRYQDTFYNVINKDGKVLNRYPDKQEALEEVGVLENSEDYTIEKFVERKSIETLKPDLNALLERILSSAYCTDYIIALSGYSNFRYKFASLLPYKGDRNKDDKPVWLEVIKDYIREKDYLHKQVEFLEADDVMSATYTMNPHKQMVICSTDKDLRTVPSWNYNIMSGEYQEIDVYKARYNFYTQLLIGDSTDNIPSPYGLGPESAKGIIGSIYGLADPQDIDYYQTIVPEYQRYLNMKNKDGTYKTKWYNPSMNVHEILYEVGNLLWMRRTLDEDERWQIPV